MLLRAVAGGLKGGAVYVARDGLNADGSAYAYGAALDAAGAPTPRHAVLQQWGAFLQTHGTALLSAKAVTNRVAVVVDGTKVAEDTTAPYTFRYTAPDLAPGELSRPLVVSARATDNAGAARDTQLPLLVISK
mgnify:CR=1 FL=1